MNPWTYADAEHRIAIRNLGQGAQESCLASALPEDTPIAPFVPSPAQLLEMVTAAAQERLDAFARTRAYDGILSVCSYAADDPLPRFAAEGQRARVLRSATWAALYEMLAQVEAGTRPVPASFAEIEPELPALTWEE